MQEKAGDASKVVKSSKMDKKTFTSIRAMAANQLSRLLAAQLEVASLAPDAALSFI